MFHTFLSLQTKGKIYYREIKFRQMALVDLRLIPSKLVLQSGRYEGNPFVQMKNVKKNKASGERVYDRQPHQEEAETIKDVLFSVKLKSEKTPWLNAACFKGGSLPRNAIYVLIYGCYFCCRLKKKNQVIWYGDQY